MSEAVKRGRGRPAGRVFSLEELADLLWVDGVWLERLLDRAAASGGALSFFQRARKVGGEWVVPEADVRALLRPEGRARGSSLPRLYPVGEFARIIGVKEVTLRSWIAAGAVPVRWVMGRMRISEEVYYRLPAQLPACVPGRPAGLERGGAAFSFSAAEDGNDDESRIGKGVAV